MNIINKQTCELVLCISNTHGDFASLFNEIANMIGKNKNFPEIEMPHIDSVKTATISESLLTKSLKLDSVGAYSGETSLPTLIIVSGNNGLIMDEKDLYLKELSKYDNYLESKNSCVVFVHGNEDNPVYFTDNLIQTKCIQTVPDYTVIKTAKHNILCIGGKAAEDRIWRKIHQDSTIRYFSTQEMPELNASLLEEITKQYPIDGVVTQSYPTFIGSTVAETSKKWGKKDTSLSHDILMSRIVIDNIYQHLIINNTSTIEWMIGDECNDEWYINNVHFQSVFSCRYMFEEDRHKPKKTRNSPKKSIWNEFNYEF